MRDRLLDCDDPATRLARRVERLARELALSPDHELRWAFVGAMSSCAWALEDGEPPE
jgi:streptomycin 6-kinase